MVINGKANWMNLPILFMLVGLLCSPAFAWQQSVPQTQTQTQMQADAVSAVSGISPAKPLSPASPLSQLGSEYQNSIKLLQNRFRIDYQVDEVTMIFFREYGSPPVVLVKPDGSKIFQSQADGAELFWYDTATYDMVSLKKPTPGPWQAVGQILPDSRVMVISDISLHAEPLPKIIFSGEILKQTAYLTNDGKPIDYTAFRDVVELSIEFVSTNNPNFNNFGAQSQLIATFEDNGKGMDERPQDGIFTGQFNLAIADGEWTPKFSVSTPMFTREQVDPTLMLYPNPIKISVEMDGGGKGFHKLLIDAERELVDMSTLLIDGKVRFPNGDIQNFSITDMSADVREYLVVNYEFGVYRVKLTAYGNTVDGREFILDVPEYSFLSEAAKPAAPALNGESSAEAVAPELEPQIEEQTTAATTLPDLPLSTPITEKQAIKKSMSTGLLITLVIGINVLIIGGGSFLLWFFMLRKPKSQQKTEGKEPSEEEAPVKQRFWQRWFRKKTPPKT
jgi:uncharacterized protein (TIGR03503 family)